MSRQKSSSIFSKISPLNTDTQLTQTWWHVPLVSVLMGFHCIANVLQNIQTLAWDSMATSIAEKAACAKSIIQFDGPPQHGGMHGNPQNPNPSPDLKSGFSIPFPRLDQGDFSTQSHYLPKNVSVQFLTLAKSDQNLTVHQKKSFTLSQTKCIKRHL